ncbi:MAG: ComEA family DNA-binding protein [Jatrophihabitans endophyticus]|nr:ComEA family DNA-binding protein [Jatrophihabitans endophyticus]
MARVPVRLDPGRRAALAVGVAVIVAALVAGAWLVANRPQAVPVSAAAPSVPGAGPLVGTDGVTEGAGAAGSTAAAAPTPAAPSPTGSAEVVVDVAGKVRNPGVYRLPTGSRVDDAVHAAGGVRGRVDLSRLNLAAPLVDGQQIAVGVPAAAGGGAPVAAGASSSGGTVVDINTATLEELETLPGVGPVLGQDILDYRDAHGSFTTIQQLENVSGIGDVTFGDLKSLVTV